MHTFYSIIVVTIGIYISVLLNHWLTIKDAFSNSFFNTNIADAMNPIVTVLLTLFLDFLNEYKFLIDDLEKNFNDYVELKNEIFDETYEKDSKYTKSINSLKLFEKKIISSFKKASMKLDTLSKVQVESIKKEFINIKILNTSVRSLKQKITDDPFGQKKKFNDRTLTTISVSFENLKREIFLEKIKFFK
jgi:hypothetical protein